MTVKRFTQSLTLLGVAALLAVLAPAARAQERPRGFAETLLAPQAAGVEIGVTLRDVSEDDLKSKQLKSEAGAVIERVNTDGPAATAGFRAGDVVLSFDGERVRSARHLTRLITDTPEGRDVEAIVWREGKEVTLTVAPESRFTTATRSLRIEPREVRRFTAPEFEFPRFEADRFFWEYPDYALRREGGRWVFGAGTGARLGAGVQELTDQLGEYFGASGGVLVTTVEDSSAAKTSGLRAGDVITRINDDAVRSTADLRRLLDKAGSEATLTVIRDRKELTLKVTFGDSEVRAPRRIIR